MQCPCRPMVTDVQCLELSGWSNTHVFLWVMVFWKTKQQQTNTQQQPTTSNKNKTTNNKQHTQKKMKQHKKRQQPLSRGSHRTPLINSLYPCLCVFSFVFGVCSMCRIVLCLPLLCLCRPRGRRSLRWRSGRWRRGGCCPRGHAAPPMQWKTQGAKGAHGFIFAYIYILDLHMTPYGVMLHECKLVAENLHRKLK